MAETNELAKALRMIAENLNKANTSNEAIAAIEAENEKLRQEKIELNTKLNQLLKVKSTQVVLLQDLTANLETRKKMETDCQKMTAIHMKERSQQAAEHIKICKEHMKQADNSMVLPYDKVVEKIKKLEIKTEKNLQRSRTLSDERKKQSQNLMKLKEFKEILKLFQKDQEKQLKRG